jgi:hypothetical protein
MAKIPLTISKNYCADWGVFQGIRELLQNAKDADEDGHKMTIEHFPRTSRLEITSAKVYVDPAKLLVLGMSDKMPGTKRGQFGEGFVLGVLALMRKGCDVSFRNGDLSWTVSFEEPDPGHPLAGNELMTFKSRTLASREQDFRVEIENIPTEVWDVLKKLFLFITPTPAAETLETPHGTLLLGADYVGQVFSRGIFVRKFADLACGYDMVGLQLDRDRRFIDEWDLHYKLGRIWKDACETYPSLAAPRLYDMAKTGAVEAKNVKYHADEKLLKDVRERFEKEHGPAAVPVATMAEAKDLEDAGGKPTMVNDVLKELLEKGGLSVKDAKKQLEGQISARFVPSDLGPAEFEPFARLTKYVDEFILVTFTGKAACRLIDEDKKIGLDRRLLAEPFSKVLKQLVAVEARRRNIEPVDVLIEQASRIETPHENDACDECGERIRADHPSMVNPDHADSCSLYPSGDGPA